MKMPSDHFDGRRFYNPTFPRGMKRSLLDVAIWMLRREVKPWPFVDIQQQKVKQVRTQTGECDVTFINHSTVLLQIEGVNILFDPIWSKRASPFSWMGPKRSTLPGVKFEDLPPIDFVLISHNHYDHLDLPTLKRLEEVHQPVFFVSQGNCSYLASKGLIQRVHELDWWDQSFLFGNYYLYFVPSQHFAARGIFDRDKSLWGGYVVKGLRHMIYFAGDTGFSSHFAEIRQRLGAPTLSILPIGAYEPRWLMQPVHLSPEEAVQAHLILESKQSLGVHFGTFQLTDEDRNAPPRELARSLKRHDLPSECFWILEPGQARKLD